VTTGPGSGLRRLLGVLDHLRQERPPAAPGCGQGLYLIVSDIQAARKELLDYGVEVSEVFHGGNKVYAGADDPYLFGLGDGYR
jgi:hypothetical protein